MDTSVGPDGIANVLLSKCAPGLAAPLSHLFDNSFKDGVLPVCWKNADVIPIHKKAVHLNRVTIDLYR